MNNIERGLCLCLLPKNLIISSLVYFYPTLSSIVILSSSAILGDNLKLAQNYNEVLSLSLCLISFANGN